jgi:ATP-dependent protease ClpP protease subunit
MGECKEIYFGEKITEDSITNLIRDCQGSNKIKLILNSQGGSPIPAIAFYNFVKSQNIELEVEVVSDCCSAAILLLVAGTIRKAAKNTFFLLHMLCRSYEGRTFTVAELESEITEMKQGEERLQKMVAEVIKKKPEDLLPIFKAEKHLTAYEAFELGLLTEKPY